MGTGTAPSLLQRERFLVHLHLPSSLKVRQLHLVVLGMDALVTVVCSASLYKTPSPSPTPAVDQGHTG